ncbi:hypothetical protein BGX21_007636, partial [Mortierella sp. AD011]
SAAGEAYLIVESDKGAEVEDLNEEEFDFKANDFDEVDFDDSSNNENDIDGLDLDQIDLDGSYNVESNSEGESVPRVETDLDCARTTITVNDVTWILRTIPSE